MNVTKPQQPRIIHKVATFRRITCECDSETYEPTDVKGGK
eukprot:CAMPEP_0168253658 /NCGR_PEP_ID=MMETSP0141_2-20121125/4326_1 /TAXON_ID=44445 /ORGANISM="Pseudo-nitzschia australis, Strain 10249 10 AB" /LENGTH=39 /DNA_ID= /DNA_START= /DNA_END= /DNA_ORIENTATION=